MPWEVRLHPEVEAWYMGVRKSDPETADLIEDAIDQLAGEGPALRRPAGGPGQGQAEDKAGNWEGWYREMIPIADERFARHLAELESGEANER